jgi:hypothetical protein
MIVWELFPDDFLRRIVSSVPFSLEEKQLRNGKRKRSEVKKKEYLMQTNELAIKEKAQRIL